MRRLGWKSKVGSIHFDTWCLLIAAGSCWAGIVLHDPLFCYTPRLCCWKCSSKLASSTLLARHLMLALLVELFGLHTSCHIQSEMESWSPSLLHLPALQSSRSARWKKQKIVQTLVILNHGCCSTASAGSLEADSNRTSWLTRSIASSEASGRSSAHDLASYCLNPNLPQAL